MTATKRPARIQFPDDIYKDVEKHAYSNLEAEVGGMLFGTISGGKTQIVGFVPALKATAEQISLTFTHEVWEDILKKGESKFPGKQIVGWYHTHPSFGIFLSDYDEFIQNNFFNQPGQVALVIDPIAGKLGWFEKKGEKVVLLSEETTNTGPKKAKPTKSASPAASKKAVLTIVVTSLVTAALTFGVSVAIQPPNLSGALKSAKSQIQLANEQIGFLQAQLGYQQGLLMLNYTAREGDTIETISQMFYGDLEGVQVLMDANPSITTNEVPIGTAVLIPSPTGISTLMPMEETPEKSEKK